MWNTCKSVFVTVLEKVVCSVHVLNKIFKWICSWVNVACWPNIKAKGSLGVGHWVEQPRPHQKARQPLCVLAMLPSVHLCIILYIAKLVSRYTKNRRQKSPGSRQVPTSNSCIQWLFCFAQILTESTQFTITLAKNNQLLILHMHAFEYRLCRFGFSSLVLYRALEATYQQFILKLSLEGGWGVISQRFLVIHSKWGAALHINAVVIFILTSKRSFRTLHW